MLAIDTLHHILNKATSQGHLHPLYGRETTLHASLYDDDAAIFVKPIKEDIQWLVIAKRWPGKAPKMLAPVYENEAVLIYRLDKTGNIS